MKKLEEFRQKFKELGVIYLEEREYPSKFIEVSYDKVISIYDINKPPTEIIWHDDDDFYVEWIDNILGAWVRVSYDIADERYEMELHGDEFLIFSSIVYFDKNECIFKQIDQYSSIIQSKLQEVNELESKIEELKSMLQ